MRKIKLTQGYHAIVDDEDYDKLSVFKWQYHNGYAKRGEYCERIKNNKSIKMHRVIMNCPLKLVVHHKNHNPLDNRKSNLQIVTRHKNSKSQRNQSNAKYSSKYQGVFKRVYSSGKESWTAKIKVNYRNIYLGTFQSEDEAGFAYNLAAKKYFKEVAVLNRVPSGTKVTSKEDRRRIMFKNLTSQKTKKV